MGGVVRGENEKCDEQGASEAAWVGGARVHSLIISGRVCLRRPVALPPKTSRSLAMKPDRTILTAAFLRPVATVPDPWPFCPPDYRAEARQQQARRINRINR